MDQKVHDGTSAHLAKQIITLKKDLKSKDEEILELKRTIEQLKANKINSSESSLQFQSQSTQSELLPGSSAKQLNRRTHERNSPLTPLHSSQHSPETSLDAKDVLLERYKKKLISYKSKLILLQSQHQELLIKFDSEKEKGKEQKPGTLSTLFGDSNKEYKSEIELLKQKLHSYKSKLRYQNELMAGINTENTSLKSQVTNLQELLETLSNLKEHPTNSSYNSDLKKNDFQAKSLSETLEKKDQEILELNRKYEDSLQLIEEIKQSFEQVTKKFESKYKELQLDNKALEESCSVLASQIETLMTENMNDKDSGMHNSRRSTNTTNFQEEGKAILNTVASQLSVGLNQVTSNVSIETQNKKIEERKALNICYTSVVIPCLEIRLTNCDLIKLTGFVHRTSAAQNLFDLTKLLNHNIVIYENGEDQTVRKK